MTIRLMLHYYQDKPELQYGYYWNELQQYSHKQKDQREDDPRDREDDPFFEDARLGHKHPERGDHKKEEGKAEEDIQEEKRFGGLGFMQPREFIDHGG